MESHQHTRQRKVLLGQMLGSRFENIPLFMAIVKLIGY